MNAPGRWALRYAAGIAAGTLSDMILAHQARGFADRQDCEAAV